MVIGGPDRHQACGSTESSGALCMLLEIFDSVLEGFFTLPDQNFHAFRAPSGFELEMDSDSLSPGGNWTLRFAETKLMSVIV